MGSAKTSVRTPPLPSVLDKADLLLLHALRHQARSRAELALETDWSRNTVAARLGRLIDEGWVVETGIAVASGDARSFAMPSIRRRL
ncbi:winged helix-turn-helix domain-containing protein [Rubellimicrobium thermophilum]|uniref:winged helix-turn-helix transcriptional regulator n=1 Tax=Rubellimicrobium thermophilum TaxID=295419 RepID=UPI00146C67DF